MKTVTTHKKVVQTGTHRVENGKEATVPDEIAAFWIKAGLATEVKTTEPKKAEK